MSLCFAHCSVFEAELKVAVCIISGVTSDAYLFECSIFFSGLGFHSGISPSRRPPEAKDDDAARTSSTSGREPRSHQGAEERESASDAADDRQRLQRQRLRSGVPPLADGRELPHAEERPV